VALRVLPVDDEREAVVQHQPVQVNERDAERLAERLVDVFLGHEVQLEEGVTEAEPGLLLVIERDLELVLGDRLGLDQDVAQPVLLAVPVQDGVELPLRDRALTDQDLAQRGRRLRFPLQQQRRGEVGIGDEPFPDQDLAEQAAPRLGHRRGRRFFHAVQRDRPSSSLDRNLVLLHGPGLQGQQVECHQRSGR
jgi:hypothetical protein